MTITASLRRSVIAALATCLCAGIFAPVNAHSFVGSSSASSSIGADFTPDQNTVTASSPVITPGRIQLTNPDYTLQPAAEQPEFDGPVLESFHAENQQNTYVRSVQYNAGSDSWVVIPTDEALVGSLESLSSFGSSAAGSSIEATRVNGVVTEALTLQASPDS